MERKGMLTRGTDLGRLEHWASLIVGGALLVYGLVRSLRGLVWIAVSGLLLYRVLNGRSVLVWQEQPKPVPQDVEGMQSYSYAARVEEAITINRPVEQVYRFWRRLENLPRFMVHLEAVTPENGHAHWVGRTPGPIPVTLTWDTEVVADRENQLLTWRSTPGSQVEMAGSVRFLPAPGDRGTEVHMVVAYSPPMGFVGNTFARLFNPVTEQQVKEDLRRLKHLLETGEIPSTEGQPAGANRG